MTKTKVTFLIWILVFLLIYFRNGSPAAIMAVAFALFYAVAAFLLSRLTGRRLEVRIQDGGLADKDVPMTEELFLRNAGKLPVFLAEGFVTAENRLTGETQRKKLAVSLWPGQERKEILEIREKYCGRVDTALTRLRVYDPLKLFGADREVSGSGTGYVAPALTGVEIPAEYLDSYDMESYQYSQYEKGSDTGEVFGIREYQEGDSPKQIHWKLSAKMDDMVVKIPSYPIENNILLLLDNLLMPGMELTPERKSKLMELFWSLSGSLLEKDLPHSVAWYDGEAECVRLHEVRSRQEMWNVIPETLSCGFSVSQVSTIYRYLENMEGHGFSNHFLVTAQEDRDIESLEKYGAVKVFRETE